MKNENLFLQLTQNLTDPEKIFVEIPKKSRFSYAEMFLVTNQYANALCRIGIKKGDRVILQSEKCLECIWVYLACIKIGATLIPINPSYTHTEIIFFLEDAKPSLFISGKYIINTKLAKSIEKRGINLVTLTNNHNSLDKIAFECSKHFQICFSKLDDVVTILYTSGTTGHSKGVMLTIRNLYSNAVALMALWNFSKHDILLHILPLYHTHGLFVALNTVLVSNSSILFFESFNATETIKQFACATVLMGVPTHYIRLLNEKMLTRASAKKMRLFISGSAPLSTSTHREFKQYTGHSILERYGMTETSMITSNPYRGKRKPGTVGLPLPDVEVKVTSISDGTILANGQVGSIEVRGPNVFKGYWGNSSKLNMDFSSDGFFTTGDLGFFDDEGYLNISGRKKDLIISGGLNVYPAEVEMILDNIEYVKESAVIGLPHHDFGEGVTAVVILNSHIKNHEKVLQDRVRENLARFKVPLRILAYNELPKNPMGKVQKSLLREQLQSLYSKK